MVAEAPIFLRKGHWIVVERWLDRQVNPPRWRSKNRRERVRLARADALYLKDREEA